MAELDRAHELLPEFRRRLARRRLRDGAAGAAVLLVMLGVGVAVMRHEPSERRGVVTASSTTTVTTAAPVPEGLDIGPALDPDEARLPDEGIAVEVASRVVLVGMDGRVHGHLPGFSIHQDIVSTAGPLRLRQDDRYYVLADGTLREVPIVGGYLSDPLAYDAELAAFVVADPGHNVVRRGGRELFDVGNNLGTRISVSYDRDLVADGDRALDLRTGKFHDLPEGCDVGDRHGPRWYLLCDDVVRAGDLPAVSAGVLLRPPHPGSGGHWRKAMVSPDGKRLLLQWSGECEVQEVFFAAGNGTGTLESLGSRLGAHEGAVMAEAYGWTADGRAVVATPAEPGCGQGLPQPGVYVVGTGRPARPVYPLPPSASGAQMAMWSPALR